MKNSEESDEDVEDSAVWSSLIGNIVAIIISAYLWLLQQNPNRKNNSNFNPDLLNNALKDLKQLALELTKQNETNNNESQCHCTSENQEQSQSKNDGDKTDEGESAENPPERTETETVQNVNTYTVEKDNENSLASENSLQKSAQKEKRNHHHEKICDICIECLHNAISQTSTSTKSSTFNQEYRPYQEPEYGKKPKCKSKKYDKNKIKKGIADAQRAIKYLQDMQEQFDYGSSQPSKNTSEQNLQKSNKKTTFQSTKTSKKKESPENQQNRTNRTVIQYDSDYRDELAPDDCLQCSSSCSIVKLDQTPCQSAKQNPNSTNKDKTKSRFPQKQNTESDYEQSYSEDSSQLHSQQFKGKSKNNSDAENCTYMKDPCNLCERLDPTDAEKNYLKVPPSPPVERNELDEETCTYMQDPCKPCEPTSNVPASRLPRFVPKPDPRKQQMENFEENRAGAGPEGGRLCKGLRQPNVTSPVYQSAGNRGYGQGAKSPRSPNAYPGYPQQNYGQQQAYLKTPAADSRRQDYQSFNPRQSPRGNYPQGYMNPKYEKAMNTLTVERMDASSETGEFTQNYNQNPTSNQHQYLQQMQPNQYPNQQGRQREFVNGNRGREYKRPILFQQTEEIEYTQYPNAGQQRDYGEVRYRNEELQPMPVAAIPLKTSSNTIDVSKCPRYLK